MGKLIDAVELNNRLREWAKISDTADLNTVLDVFEIIDDMDGIELPHHGRKNNEGLLPCPFCGNRAVNLENYGDGDNEAWMICCQKCGIGVSAPGGEDGCCDPTVVEAIQAWNRRV